MDLPFRIQTEPGSEPVISVDGAFGAPGLNLSHWPGNTTPEPLKRDLSTEIALAFSALPAPERAALTQGCVAVCNNHYDTDGVCAAFALLHPEEAARRAPALVAAAAAGDLFRVPDQAAFVTDAILTGLADGTRSPWAARFAGLSDGERHERASRDAIAELPRILDAPGEFAPLWEDALARLEDDRRRLAACFRDDLVHFDFTFWSAGPEGSGGAGDAGFDPGRHALFGSTDADRVLVSAPAAGGFTHRLVIGTLSWFDLERFVQPRPDLDALCAALNELEGCARDADVRWQHEPADGASPEVWFGTGERPRFSEHAADVLRASALEPVRVKAAVVDALRAVFVFPDDDA